MVVALDSVLSILLIVLGYVAVCYVLHHIKWNKIDVGVLKLSRNKILYLSSVLIVCGIMIYMLQFFYKIPMLSQFKLLTLILILFPTAAVDYKIKKIPNKFLIAGLILRMVFYIFEFIQSFENAFSVLKDNLLAVVIYGVFFLLLLLVFKNSIGMGDIKLFALMGLYQGIWGTFSAIFFSLVVSFFVSIYLLITRKKKKKDTIPFGPSILIGTFLSICLSGM